MSIYSCPNCGDRIEPAFEFLKLVSCPSCETTLFLDDAQARLAGERGVMHDAPLLIRLGDTADFGPARITLHGHARFGYGRGYWDEFWGVGTPDDVPYWVSVDEGDVVVQRAIAEAVRPKARGTLKVGDTLQWTGRPFVVTEDSQAECIALRGSFDEELHVGETYRFINATGDAGELLSGEFWRGGEAWFEGVWIDPYDVKIDRAA